MSLCDDKENVWIHNTLRPEVNAPSTQIHTDFCKAKNKTDLLLSPFCRPMSEGLKRDLEKITIIFNVAFFPRRFTEKYFQDSFYKNHECCYICMGLWLNG